MIRLSPFLIFLGSSAAFAADPVASSAVPPTPITFQGITGSADASQVRLWFVADGYGSGWIKPGQAFGDYVLIRYDAKKSVATVQKGDAAPFDLELQSPHVKSGAGSVLTREQALKGVKGWWTVREISTGMVFSPPLETMIENSDQAAVFAELKKYGLNIDMTRPSEGSMTIAGGGIMLTTTMTADGTRGVIVSASPTTDGSRMAGPGMPLGGPFSPPAIRNGMPPEIAAGIADADLGDLTLMRMTKDDHEYTFVLQYPKAPRSSAAAPKP